MDDFTFLTLLIVISIGSIYFIKTKINEGTLAKKRKKTKKTVKLKKNIQINNYFPGLMGAIIVGGIFLVIFAFTSGETVFWIIAAPVALIFLLMLSKAITAATSTSDEEVKRAQQEYRDLERSGSNYMDSVFGMFWKIIKYSIMIGGPIIVVILLFN
jgi:ABC-type polysaccharide/polyol phosphate export permease